MPSLLLVKFDDYTGPVFLRRNLGIIYDCKMPLSLCCFDTVLLTIICDTHSCISLVALGILGLSLRLLKVWCPPG